MLIDPTSQPAISNDNVSMHPTPNPRNMPGLWTLSDRKLLSQEGEIVLGPGHTTFTRSWAPEHNSSILIWSWQTKTYITKWAIELPIEICSKGRRLTTNCQLLSDNSDRDQNQTLTLIANFAKNLLTKLRQMIHETLGIFGFNVRKVITQVNLATTHLHHRALPRLN